MLPLKLTIQGLYSYQQSQTIDFEKLTTSQLFGIFGEVGSGKSSVLEAMVFVLYDQNERLNKKNDNRYYNMLNLRSQRLSVDFEFQVATPEPTKYRFTVVAERKKKDYEKVEIKKRAHYRWQDQRWEPITVTDPASVVGMTYENFMQTVIIPQGKFRAFIDQPPRDRTKMLMELFRLERFELSAKTNHLLSETKAKGTALEARLSEVGTVTDEMVDEVRREATRLEMVLPQHQSRLKESDQQCQHHEQLKKKLAEQEAAQARWQALLAQQEDFQQRARRLHEYREAELHFHGLFENLATRTRDQEKMNAEYHQVLTEVTVCEKRVSSASAKEQVAKEDYTARDTMRAQCTDLEHLVAIERVEAERRQLQQEEQQVKAEWQQLARQAEDTKTALQKTEQQRNAIDDRLRQQTALREVHHWHQQQQAYQQTRAHHAQQLADQQSALTELNRKKAELLATHDWSSPVDDMSQFFRQLAQQGEQLHDTSRRLLSEQGACQARIKLAEQAQQLTPGEGCPLCGSTHHPSVAHADQLLPELQRIEEQMTQLQQQQSQHRALEEAMRQWQAEEVAVTSNINRTQAQQQEADEQLARHDRTFEWDAYRSLAAQDVAAQVKQTDAHLAEQAALRKQSAQRRQQFEQQDSQRQKAQEQWQRREEQQRALQRQAEDYRARLRVLTYERHQQYNEQQLKDSLEKGRARYEKAEQTYQEATERLQTCQNDLIRLTTKRQEKEHNLHRLQTQITATEQEILRLCQEKAFEDVAHVQSIISLKLNKEQEEAQIGQYNQQLHTAQQEVERLERETENQRYDAAQHQQDNASCVRLRQEIEAMQQQYTLVRQTIKDQQARRQKIEQLTRQLEKQQQREGHLKTMSALFWGSGFVKYASSVLLREVCAAANVRFKQLTQNNLSLELNHDNDFIVRDYLNDGKTRLLKTLSGGQTFQAALCLALALAENIRSLNQSQRSFFFLDEGFGSLDKASLRVVFDTLKSLRKENRIVGIISHVEELQQEIDVYLTIKNDQERGSLIQCSWK